MKNRFLILTLIGLIASTVPARAELTTGDIAGPGYLKNHGHSGAMVEATQIMKTRAGGQEYIEPEKKSITDTTPIKYIKEIVNYIDPGGDGDTFLKHDIKPYSNYRDF